MVVDTAGDDGIGLMYKSEIGITDGGCIDAIGNASA